MSAKADKTERELEALRTLTHSIHASRTPAKAMQLHCIRCRDNSYTRVRQCKSAGCSLWPYRLGTNPFDGSEEGS